jgi:hypothetical protein
MPPVSPEPARHWIAQHVALSNPRGRGQDDVPRLLRRLAKMIDGLGDVQVLDLLMHIEITEDGPWPAITVYYSSAEQPES